MKKVIWFVGGGMIAVISYLLGIGIYTRISVDPIIFFASLIIAAITITIICVVIKKVTKALFDRFTISMIWLVYYLGVAFIAVFGPTFIDRSISYHLAFYAVEENVIYVEDIEQAFLADVANKRVHDAVVTGFLTQNGDESLSPTFKAQVMYHILKPLGELTNSLDTYHNMKEEVK